MSMPSSMQRELALAGPLGQRRSGGFRSPLKLACSPYRSCPIYPHRPAPGARPCLNRAPSSDGGLFAWPAIGFRRARIDGRDKSPTIPRPSRAPVRSSAQNRAGPDVWVAGRQALAFHRHLPTGVDATGEKIYQRQHCQDLAARFPEDAADGRCCRFGMPKIPLQSRRRAS
jgi:hypothetical protein